MKYEYEMLACKEDKVAVILQKLNELGEKGWELATHATIETKPRYFYFTFKRPKEQLVSGGGDK